MAMMFLGASIATTAFPMLARIIYERGLSGTPLGTLALACGATDDALSWCILATVLAIHRGSVAVAAIAIIGGILYTLLLLTIGRRLLRGLAVVSERHNAITAPVLSTVLILLMACAWITDTVGIYAIFGAFILGVAMPSGFFGQRLTANLEPLVTTFLLPLFFVYSGLNTQIGLVNSPALWAVTLGILVVSIAGKGVACAVAARIKRVPLRESLALGALMNARGLIELILLNIGLEAGIITPTLFTILVLVAIITTLMATPVFEFVYRRRREMSEHAEMESNLAVTVSPQRPVTSPLLLGVTDGFEALAHASQRLVENLHLFTALFVGLLGGATGTFGLHSRRTLAAQQAEVLVARIPEPALQIFQRLRVHTCQSVGMSLGDQGVFLRGQVHMVVAHR